MENNELDDLFRSNADYLADEPPRGFDKDAFWQQLQTQLPKKADRQKRPAVWWWAAASVLLAGTLGGIWWMQSGEQKAKTIAEKKASPPETLRLSEAGTGLNRTSLSAKVGPLRGQFAEKSSRVMKPEESLFTKKETPGPTLPNLPAPPEIAPMVVTIRRPAIPLPAVENLPGSSEVSDPVAPEKPAYRVVHINEIRQRKQQEAKAQSRVVFRLGVLEPPAHPETIEDKFKLSIPIPH